jgi:hypothetical protein
MVDLEVIVALVSAVIAKQQLRSRLFTSNLDGFLVIKAYVVLCPSIREFHQLDGANNELDV